MTDTTQTPTPFAETGATFLGHPRGLMTLFFTEMWERFSYYGMRAILILFLVDAAATHGFGLDDRTATAIYGLYTAGVYLAALPGGWIADRFMGAQRAVWWGGVLIMCGHILLAIAATRAMFYFGLFTIVAGTGLLKPNIAAIVADLYPEGGGRRDSGYTIFYFGINLGGFLGPLVVAYLAKVYGWHVGFGAAAVGMALGLLQFHLTRSQLGGAGTLSSGRLLPADAYLGKRALTIGLTVLAAVLVLLFTGAAPFNPIVVRDYTAYVIVAMAAAFFVAMLFFAGLEGAERNRIWVVLAFFTASTLFWAGFEQQGSSFNLFADRYTDLHMSTFNFDIPAGWFQSVNSLFILIFAPVFAAMWLALDKRHRDPPTPVKLALGLVFLGTGFVVMAAAAHFVVQGDKVLPTWLIATFLLHTFGELALSPIGMSAVTKLVPHRFVGQAMGIWYLSLSLGNLLASSFAGDFDANNLGAMPGQFMNIFWFAVIPGVVLWALVKPLRKAAGGVS